MLTTRTIPLRDITGRTVAEVLVDAVDVEWLSQWRWCLSGGYARRTETVDGRGRTVFMHRQIVGLARTDPRVVDHLNHQKLDNRRANLAVVTRAENGQNRPALSGGRSSHRGVCFHEHSGKWRAYLKVNGRKISGGYFEDEEDAARAAADLRATHLPHSEEGRAVRQPVLDTAEGR